VTRVIGLTGGIGSGKSSVAAVLAELGAVVIDADAIVHELQAPGAPMLDTLAEAFGPEILDAAGALDRKALADRVFDDAEARTRLGNIVHPPTGVEMARRLEAARAAGAPVVVLDIPLLLEGRARGGGGFGLDAIVVVWVPEDVQLARAVARDAAPQEEIRARIRAQMPLDEKRALADRVIDNSGTPEETRRQVEALYRELAGEDAA
jgi:dephospho-CoA kinase